MALTLRLMLEPQQGGTYAQFRAVTQAAEQAGYDAVFRSDHLMAIGGAPQPALEAWTVLAGLARDTTRVRLGTLVTPMTFRHPSVLARQVVTVDEMSGGRIELGVGTGWFEAEHRTLGIPFPAMRERTDRLEECVEVITRLWTGQPVSYEGRYYGLDDAVALPRPVQNPLPLLVGGHGGPRSTSMGARFAAEYNTTSIDPEGAAQTYAKARAACEAIGRDPASLRLSWMGTVLVGRDDAAVRRRAQRLAEWNGMPDADPVSVVERTAPHSAVGTYDQAADKLRAYVDAGAERIYARIFDLDDLDQISEIAGEVLPRVVR
jgi:F420-dependent oxidoreductase-like protein